MAKRQAQINLKQTSSNKLKELLGQVDAELAQRELKKHAFNDFLQEAKRRGYDLPSLIELMRINQ